MKQKIPEENPLDIFMSPASKSNERILPIKKKTSLTIHIAEETTERTKNAVFWTPGLTLSRFVEDALVNALDSLEEKSGKPFPERPTSLKKVGPFSEEVSCTPLLQQSPA